MSEVRRIAAEIDGLLRQQSASLAQRLVDIHLGEEPGRLTRLVVEGVRHPETTSLAPLHALHRALTRLPTSAGSREARG